MKPLRGKRVGSVRSARRIQPGGPGQAGPGATRTARSSRPAAPLGGARRRGPGGRGPGGSCPRRAHFLRGGAPRPAPGRLGRPRGRKVAGVPGEGRGSPLPLRPGVTAPPRQEQSPSPGAEGADRLRALLRIRPAPTVPRPPSPSGVCGRGPSEGSGAGEGGRGPPLSARSSNGADCPQCAPTAPRRRGGRAPEGAQGVRGDVGDPPDPS